MQNIKVCGICKKQKAINEFSKSKSRKDGLNYSCKECNANYYIANKERYKEYRETNREHYRELGKLNYVKQSKKNNAPLSSVKICSYCKIEKSITEFNKQKDKSDGLNSRCSICRMKYGKIRYEKNKEHILFIAKQWKHSNRGVEYSKKYKTERRKTVNNSITLSQWDSLCEKYDWCCAYCGKRDKLTIDHIIPLKPRPVKIGLTIFYPAAGEHIVKNIVPACLSCNSSKCNISLEDWLELNPDKRFRNV